MKSATRNATKVFAAAILPIVAILTTDARAGDFVFGDDFDSAPECLSASGFAVVASPVSRASTLGIQSHFFVKVRSCGNTGSNALAVSGGPATWTKVLDPTSIALASNASGVALLTVTIPSDGDAGAATFDITAQAGATTVHASAMLDVANQYIVTIADGTGIGDHHFPSFVQLRVGTLLRILDADSVALHRIHADGGNGFVHQTGEMGQGQEYDMTPTMPSIPGLSYDFYCHDHGTATGETQINVVP